MVSFMHEQNYSICSQKQLNNIAHEHAIICGQLFAVHMVGSRPMKRKKHLHRKIIPFNKLHCRAFTTLDNYACLRILNMHSRHLVPLALLSIGTGKAVYIQ